VPYLPHTSPDHDETLIAQLAAADLPEDDRDGRQARSLVADCPGCAELLADLRAIVSATAELPAPRRTRDFRLTEADAARLRPAGWRGLLARLASPSFAFTRPLATGLATLGIAGLVLASLPAGLGGSAASAPEAGLNAGGSPAGAQDTRGSYASAAPSAAPAPAYEGPVLSSPDGRTAASVPPEAGSSPAGGGVTGSGGSKNGATPGTAAGPTAPADTSGSGAIGEREDAGAGGPPPLVILSVVLLAAGLGLGGLRLIARRVA
jgi:hypothetical protein